jgi:hypothetical protein
MAKVETAQMQLVSVLLEQKTGKDLRTYLTERRGEMIELRDGTKVRATYDDLAFWVRQETGERVVRESVRNWVHRYGIPEPEHDYGVDPESMPDGTEPATV